MFVFCPIDLLEDTGSIVLGFQNNEGACVYGLTDKCKKTLLLKSWKSIRDELELELIELGTLTTPLSTLEESINSIKWKLGNEQVVLYSYEEASMFPNDLIFAAVSLRNHVEGKVVRTASSPLNFRGFVHGWLCRLSSLKASSLNPPLLFDLVLGTAFSILLFRYAETIGSWLNAMHYKYNQMEFPQSVRWLMGYPAGLKLNSNLSKFIGELYLWLMSMWNDIYETTVLQNTTRIVQVVSLSGLLGLRTLALTVSVLFNILTFHLYAFQHLATRLYTSELAISASLWRLLRGKKWNVLHQRLDSADYSLDQLMLGTVMFTVMVFLAPTVLVYYILFSALRVGTALVQMTLKISLVLLEDLPTLLRPRATTTFTMKEYGDSDFLVLTKQSSSPLADMLKSFGTVIGHHIGGHFWSSLFKGY